MEALSKEFRKGSPWELLYADDLALSAESEDQLVESIKRWKDGIEGKGIRVNVGKTKVMHCAADAGRTVDSGKWPCEVCRQGVGVNSILCSACNKWIHKKCSGISGKLKEIDGYKCPKCISDFEGTAKADLEDKKELTLEEGVKFEMVDCFCYLGDMIGASGGAGEASRTRVGCGWKKFNELAPVLTLRGASHKMKGKIYGTFVQRAMVYGSETWPMKVDDMNRLERAERTMMRRMCGVSLRDRVPIAELRERLGIIAISQVVRKGRLRWYGHVMRKEDDDCVKACIKMEVEGKIGKGRGRKKWIECAKDDLRRLGLDEKDAEDKELWRVRVREIV
jgi:hypothetical protein